MIGQLAWRALRPSLVVSLTGVLIVVNIVSGGGSVSLTVRQAVGQPLEPDVHRTVLPNGMRAVVRERPGTDVVAISVAALVVVVAARDLAA